MDDKSEEASCTEPRMECEHCGKKFKYEGYFINHDCQDERLKCGTCGKSFKKLGLLNRHQKVHISERICDVCGIVTPNLRDFQRHLQRHDLNDPNMKDMLATLNWHRCDETGCGKVYTEKGSLVLHQLSHTDATTCKVCGFKFSFPVSLKNHMAKYHSRTALRDSSNDKPFQCDKCEKCFLSKLRLTAHKVVHKEDKIICTVCGKVFTSAQSLEVHMATHSKPIDPTTGIALPYWLRCDLCEKNLCRNNIYKHTMQCHEKLLDGNLKPASGEVTCSLCKAAVLVEEYAIHLQVEVAKYVDPQKPASPENSIDMLCEYCECVILNPAHLRLHQETHEIEKELTVKRADELRKMGNSTVSGCVIEVPSNEPVKDANREDASHQLLKCDDCGQICSRMSFLDTHLVYCKRHYCKLCGSFPTNLELHVASVHGGQLNGESVDDVFMDINGDYEDNGSSAVQSQEGRGSLNVDGNGRVDGCVFPCGSCVNTTICALDMKKHLDNDHGIKCGEIGINPFPTCAPPSHGDGEKYCCHLCLKMFRSKTLAKCHIVNCEHAHGCKGGKRKALLNVEVNNVPNWPENLDKMTLEEVLICNID